ncbi:MAG: hypothetical protein V1766_09525 [Pseudomonadota bacterium]
MAHRLGNEILYKIFRIFLDSCIIDDRSLLCPQKSIWTPTNIAEVNKRMVDSPILGDESSFEEKLQKQMDGSSPDLWGIIADIYFVYFLPSSFITFQKKISDIRWAAEQGHLILPPESDEKVWQALKAGFTRTSQRYHLKYLQFWLILRFAQEVKGRKDRPAVINNREELQKILDMVIESIPNKLDRAYDMRHAMLYMAFPDYYERIISTNDKERILNTFRNQISGPVPSDLDEAIRSVRKALSSQYNKLDHPFDFYTESELKEQWKSSKDAPPEEVVIDTEIGTVTVPEEAATAGQTDKEVTEHTKIQWMLLKLGNDMNLDVWVAKNDRNKEIDGKKFTDIPRLKNDIPLTFDEASNRTIKMIDVVWLNGNEIKAAFEIECTTSIYSGILRLGDLIAMQPNIKIPLYIVAPDDRRAKVIAEVNRPVFSKRSRPMSQICRFIAFSSLKKKIPEVQQYVTFLSPDFLETLSEPCDV